MRIAAKVEEIVQVLLRVGVFALYTVFQKNSVLTESRHVRSGAVTAGGDPLRVHTAL